MTPLACCTPSHLPAPQHCSVWQRPGASHCRAEARPGSDLLSLFPLGKETFLRPALPPSQLTFSVLPKDRPPLLTLTAQGTAEGRGASVSRLLLQLQCSTLRTEGPGEPLPSCGARHWLFSSPAATENSSEAAPLLAILRLGQRAGLRASSAGRHSPDTSLPPARGEGVPPIHPPDSCLPLLVSKA